MSAGDRPILSNIPHDMTQPMIKSTVDANNRHQLISNKQTNKHHHGRLQCYPGAKDAK